MDPSKAVSDPRNFPVAFDPAKGVFTFAATTREHLAELPFLDGRYPLSNQDPFSLPAAEVVNACPPANAPEWNFIVHPGFSCSTLLARCLDRPGSCFVVKEPGLLNRLSETKRLDLRPAGNDGSWSRLLSASLHLLFRPFAAGERVLIKASNADNGLLGEICKLNPASRVLFLTIDLKEFLLGVAKGGKGRRAFVRRLLAAHAADPDLAALFPVPPSSVAGLDDLKAAAVLWCLQNEIFRTTASAHPGGSLLFLDCGSVLSDPKAAVAEVQAFFGLPSDAPGEAARLDAILSHHAKNPAFRYDADIRAAEFRAIEAFLGNPFEQALAWGKALSGKKKPFPALKIAV
jgi:hypothetical protein